MEVAWLPWIFEVLPLGETVWTTGRCVSGGANNSYEQASKDHIRRTGDFVEIFRSYVGARSCGWLFSGLIFLASKVMKPMAAVVGLP